MKKMKEKKDFVLRASMILFVLAYPLAYVSAGSGATPFMVSTLAVVGLGSLLAALL